MIVRDVYTKAFINTMHQSQAEATLSVMWRLRHRRTRWLTVEKVCETLKGLKGASLFQKLAAALYDTLSKAVAKTIRDTLT